MEYLEVPMGTNGSIEKFGATRKLTDELIGNYSDRGNMLANLVQVTLTESPYTPILDGTRFEKIVSNRFSGYGDDDAPTSDTVDEAREVLAEFISADVDGARKFKLETFSTNYVKLMKGVLPKRGSSKSQINAFEESVVENSRRKGIEIASPAQAIEIIRQAPKSLDLLRLTDFVPTSSYRNEVNEAVTVDGRMVTTISSKTIALFGTYYDNFLPKSISKRGGRAPGSTIVHQIQRRIIDLRTKHTKR